MRQTIKILCSSPWSLLAVYIFIRLVSFTTYTKPLANEIVAGFLVGAFAFICFKNLKFGWLMLIGELLLDGAGHFFEWQQLLLRTWWLGIFGLVWFIHKIKNKEKWERPAKPIFFSLVGFGIVAVWSVINGFIHGHATTNILQDFILFCFLLLFFPAADFKDQGEKIIVPLTKIWIAGSAIFSLITFFIYSSGLGSLPDTYYHWFRNIVAGKITDLGDYFFRIVLPEHLFIVPIILVIAAYLINQPKNKKLWVLLVCSLFILTLNFSRIYFLALAVGLIVLAFKNSFKHWLAISSLIIFSIFFLFSSFHFLASRGQSIGLELLGLRTTGTTNLSSDPSGAIRLAILPDALRQIKEHPWFGSGFGAAVTYTDPTTHEQVTRTQFDWGYLEMLAELGIVGTLVFFYFFFTLIIRLAHQAYTTDETNNSPLLCGLLAGAVSLLVINLTTPALFHGFGILYIIVLLTI